MSTFLNNKKHHAPPVEDRAQLIEANRKKMMAYAKKPISIHELAPTENAALPTQLQQPIKGQRNIRMCPHFFSPAGCNLGNFCQFQHSVISTAGVSNTSTNTSAINLKNNITAGAETSNELQQQRKLSILSSSSDGLLEINSNTSHHQTPRMTSTLPAALQERQQNNPMNKTKIDQHQQQQNHTPATPINNISSYRWFWRELAKDFCSAEKGLSWRPFEEKIESTLEEAFLKWRDEAGPSCVNVCLNKFSIDFDKMQLCNAIDGGSRRSIQRIRVEAGFFWFACEQQGKAAWKFPFEVSCVLEREYISGNSTSFGIRIGPRAAALISLDTMTMQVLPEVAPLFSSVFDKEVRNHSYADLIEKYKKGGKNAHHQRRTNFDSQHDQDSNNKNSPSSSSADSPDARNPNNNKKKNRKKSTAFVDPDERGSSSSEEDGAGTDDLEEEEIEMITGEDDVGINLNMNHHGKKKHNVNSNKQHDEDDEDYLALDSDNEDDVNFMKQTHLAETILKLAQTTKISVDDISCANSTAVLTKKKLDYSNGSRILTLKLQRQPLSVTAACPATDFFNISKLRERACFVADSGEVLFINPELGPDVFSRDELQMSILPCIRAAVLGTMTAATMMNHNNNKNMFSSNTNNQQDLPPCSDKCLVDVNIYGSFLNTNISNNNPSQQISNASFSRAHHHPSFAASVRDVMSLTRNQSVNNKSATDLLNNNKLTSLAATAQHLIEKRTFALTVQHMHAAKHKCSCGGGIGGTSNDHHIDCFLHDIASLLQNYSSTSSSSNIIIPLSRQEILADPTTDPEIAKQLRFLSVSAQIRARLHEQFFSHTTTTTTNFTSSANQSKKPINPLAPSSSSQQQQKVIKDTSNSHHATSDTGVTKWYASQTFLRQFRQFINSQEREQEAMFNEQDQKTFTTTTTKVATTTTTTTSTTLVSALSSGGRSSSKKRLLLSTSGSSSNIINSPRSLTTTMITPHPPPQSSSSNAAIAKDKRKKTARIADPDQVLLPIQLLSEGTVEWNRVLEWCAQSNVMYASSTRASSTQASRGGRSPEQQQASSPQSVSPPTNQSSISPQDMMTQKIQQESQTILQLMPRIRRVDRHDLCARYKRCRNEIHSAWLRVKRDEALASSERLVFVPATQESLATLMEPTDVLTSPSSRRIVFTSFEAALLASAALNGVLTETTLRDNKKEYKKQQQKQHNSSKTGSLLMLNERKSEGDPASLDSTSNVNMNKTKSFLEMSFPPQKKKSTTTQGIIVALCYFGPQARATAVTDRLFHYPSVKSEKDPLNPDFRCVMNTSAIVEGEGSFVSLFLEAQFCPLYFISLSN